MALSLLANDVTVDTFLEYFKLINTPLCNSRVLSLYLRTYGPIVRSGDRDYTPHSEAEQIECKIQTYGAALGLRYPFLQFLH